MVDFRQIQQVGHWHTTEGGHDAVLFNLVASTIPKWWTLKLLRWMQNLRIGPGLSRVSLVTKVTRLLLCNSLNHICVTMGPTVVPIV
jgi:hypothetical protein